MQENKIRFETKVFIKAGFSIGSFCIIPMSWEGYVSLTQILLIETHVLEYLSQITMDQWVCGGQWEKIEVCL